MTGAAPKSPLLSVRGLVKHFPIKKGLLGKPAGQVRAVDNVSFDVMPGETLGLVGESGCGKSTTGRMILRLIEPTAGSVEFDGINLLTLDGGAMRKLRRRIQVIFQDPFSSLNPRMTVGSIIREGLTIHKIAEGAAADARVQQLLDEVGLSARVRVALPARVLRRSATAHRHRARARGRAPIHRLRRARFGARRFSAGAGDQPDAGSPARPRPRLPVHRARPLGGRAHRRPRRRDVPRQDRGARDSQPTSTASR